MECAAISLRRTQLVFAGSAVALAFADKLPGKAKPRFARAGDASKHHELTARYVDVNILEVMLACAACPDRRSK